MSEEQEQSQSKTEAPSPRRREEARNKGQVAFSADLMSSSILLAGVLTFWLAGSSLAGRLSRVVRDNLLQIDRQDLDIAAVSGIASASLEGFLQTTGLLLGVTALVGFAGGIVQAGLQLTPQPLQPEWSKLSPLKGWSRIMSAQSAVRGALAILKVAAIGAVGWWVLSSKTAAISWSGRGSLGQTVARGWNISLQLALAIAGCLVLLGLLDYLFQWFRHEQQLKMSRRELKEEHKEQEGDPHLKARIKRLQREASQRRMLQDVPQATVILKNPTHVAVALQYDQAAMQAPKVVAKGADLLAGRIVKIASEHRIPILERPPLARALYASVEVGQEIPPALYRAVAEILAYVFGWSRSA